MKVKIFDENHEKDLEQDINDFLSEGQEIVSKIFDKVKHKIKPKDKDLSQSKGQYCKLSFRQEELDYLRRFVGSDL